MKLTIRGKLIATCGALLAMLAVSAGLGVWQLSAANHRVETLVDEDMAMVQLAASLRFATNSSARLERELILAESDETRRAIAADIDAMMKQRDEQRARLDAVASPEVRTKLEAVDALWREYLALHGQLRPLVLKASVEHARGIMLGEGRKAQGAAEEALAAAVAELDKRAATAPAALDAARALAGAQRVLSEIDAHEKLLLLESREDVMDRDLAGIEQRDRELAGLVDSADRAGATPAPRRALDKARAAIAARTTQLATARAMARENADAKAKQLAVIQGAPLIAKASQQLNDIVVAQGAVMKQSVASSGESYRSARLTAVGAFVLALVLGLAIVTTIVRYLTRTLRAAGELARDVAGGDLTRTVEVTHHDEVGEMVTALNEMVENLRRVAHDVTTASSSVATGAEQMSASAQQVAHGASEQGAATEESTAAMEEMAASVQQNADHAQQTDRLASKAASDAQTSGQAVAETLAAMKDIAERIGIIEEIARKTDLLALNAAVEA
ncbi:MAG: HAMP domain-containing methyl-accepting chemotaxis protein, partial [Kofleriaceae bacterium]